MTLVEDPIFPPVIPYVPRYVADDSQLDLDIASPKTDEPEFPLSRDAEVLADLLSMLHCPGSEVLLIRIANMLCLNGIV